MKIIPFLLSAAVLTTPLAISAVQAQSNSELQVLPTVLGIELSQEQLTQIDQLKEQNRDKINAVTQLEQRQRFGNALKNGKGIQQAFAVAKLSNQQKKQLRQLVEESWTEAEGILTSQQQQVVSKILSTQLQAQSR